MPAFIISCCNTDKSYRLMKALFYSKDRNGNRLAAGPTILYFSLSHLLEAGSVEVY